MNRHISPIMAVGLSIFVSVACGPTSVAATPTLIPIPSTSAPIPARSSQQAEQTEAVVPTETEAAETAEPVPQTAQGSTWTSLLATRSAPSGPAAWLVFSAGADSDKPETLWAARADGTEAKPLTDDRVWVFSVQPQAADGTTHVAYITSTPDSPEIADLTLKMISLPDGAVETITALTSPDILPQNVLSVNDAITFPGSVAWSPDGKWIAFVGALKGPSADVYSYEISTGEIRQLTSGPDQAFQLLWSPDSKWIVHVAQEAFEHSGGAFQAATGIWAAAPDGSGVDSLEGMRASQFLGWVDAGTLAVEGGPRAGPAGDLRLVTVPGGKVTDLEPPCYDGVAYDVKRRVYLITMLSDISDFCPNLTGWSPGLYLVNGDQRTLIPTQDSFDPQWSPVFDMFFVTQAGSDKRIAISPSGDVIQDFPDDVPALSIIQSSDGSALAWFDGTSIVYAIGPDYQPIRLTGPFYSRQQALEWSR